MAAAPARNEVPAAVAVRPITAPTATAAAQSNGVNSARVRRSLIRKATAAVRNSTAAFSAE